MINWIEDGDGNVALVQNGRTFAHGWSAQDFKAGDVFIVGFFDFGEGSSRYLIKQQYASKEAARKAMCDSPLDESYKP